MHGVFLHHGRHLLTNRYMARSTILHRSLILGLETSCDDTGACVMDLSGKVLGESLSTQLSSRMGGIIPTIAMTFHAQRVEGVVSDCLARAGVMVEDLTAIAVTNRPGLKGPLVVGTDYAKYLCMKHQLPMIPVHHMEAHALTARLVTPVQFPFLVLLISGGHCLLALATGLDQYSLLGTGIDDSPGEALDKCARRLGLHNLPGMRDMSGGRAVELTAAKAKGRVEFPVPMRQYRDCRFSFAGVKATINDYARREEKKLQLDPDKVLPDVEDVCAGLQHIITKHLCERVQRGVEFLEYKGVEGISTLVVSGGVASNMYVRQGLSTVAEHFGMEAVYPPPRLCTDNGVMIAWNGVERWREGRGVVRWQDVLGVQVESRCPLGENIHGQVERAAIKCKWIKL